ncbi:MAG TPA: c-type cytochrome [Thiohalobacter sp.]|nr:c-type cytochrome [Thiohalobacter sp.]
MLLLAALAVGAAMVQAEPFSKKGSGHQVVMEGNSAGATGCVACHGEDGAGLAQADYPRLAGLSKPYLLDQLRAFRDGTRTSAVMERIARALSEREMGLVAEYYAGLEVPDTSVPLKDTALKARGRRLALVGKWEEGTPACVRCHGQEGQGVPPVFPRIAGQHAGYLEQELKRWQNGERDNDPIGLMRTVAESLSGQDIKAVSAWFASIPPAAPAAAGAERAQRVESPGGAGDDDGSMMEWLTQDGAQYTQPPESRIPDDAFGRLVVHGKAVFTETQQHAGQYVGNGLNCVNCHLDRGRRLASAPMGAAYVKYPKYRSKNDKVNTLVERIQGCFRYSENGEPPPPLSDTMKGLLSYFYFLSWGTPSGQAPDAAGFPDIDDPPRPPDPQRGARVFAMNCALCHGANGEGTAIDGRFQFPPLWGAASFNWGAGMHRINTAAAFIRGNMPLGHPAALDLQQAWDAAAYINSHERPQDPRYQGDLAATSRQYHDHQCYYGKRQNGNRLGEGAPE